jgi:diacylglycerol kinase (ATP)
VPDTIIIANPASGRGRGAKLIPSVRDAFAATGVTDLRTTTRSGDEATLVNAALADGAKTIVVVGGDGTWGRCAGAALDAKAGGQVRLAFISAGTGNDFAKNLGAPDRDAAAMARLVADPARVRVVDAGAVDSGGKTHWFLNVVGFGFDAVVLEDTSRGGKLGGNAVYVMAALKRILRYEGIAYTIGGSNGVTTVGMMLVISNGHTFGGAFRVAPAARVDDGVLNMVQFGDVFGWKRIPLFLSAMKGTHLSHPHVRERRGHLFEVSFIGAPKCDLDGELVQLASRDVTVRCAKGALRVVA